jgi:predicted transcriptional regulator
MLIIKDNYVDIGLKYRTSIEGPELDLVNQFIEEIPKIFKSKNNKLALFIEPLIYGSYPDIVITEYNPKLIDTWNEKRNSLNDIDFKIFENIRLGDGLTSTELFKNTNFNYKILFECIEKLYDAGLINRQNGKWKSNPLKDIYSIKRLVSVEAKMKEWTTLLNQADANQWFASESYALSSVKTPRESTINKFKDYGIGLYSLSNQKLVKLNEAKKQSLPKSYMSWMFNEWVGRYVSQS